MNSEYHEHNLISGLGMLDSVKRALSNAMGVNLCIDRAEQAALEFLSQESQKVNRHLRVEARVRVEVSELAKKCATFQRFKYNPIREKAICVLDTSEWLESKVCPAIATDHASEDRESGVVTPFFDFYNDDSSNLMAEIFSLEESGCDGVVRTFSYPVGFEKRREIIDCDGFTVSYTVIGGSRSILSRETTVKDLLTLIGGLTLLEIVSVLHEIASLESHVANDDSYLDTALAFHLKPGYSTPGDIEDWVELFDEKRLFSPFLFGLNIGQKRALEHIIGEKYFRLNGERRLVSYEASLSPFTPSN